MGAASKANGQQDVGKNGDVRIIRTEVIGGSLINVIQTSIVTREMYLGISKSDAEGLASVATSGGAGLISTSLGGIRVTVGLSYFSVFGCRGTISTATASRMGDTDLYQVEHVTQTLTCTADGGTVTNI